MGEFLGIFGTKIFEFLLFIQNIMSATVFLHHISKNSSNGGSGN